MRPLPPLNSNLKSKQLQVNDSPDNSQIPVAWVFKTSGLCSSIFTAVFKFFFLILFFIVER